MNRRWFMLGAAAAPLVPAIAVAETAEKDHFAGIHIHEAGDGLPAREVFVDGRKIEYAYYADTREGVVRYHVHVGGRIQIDPLSRDFLNAEVRGRVVVRLAP